MASRRADDVRYKPIITKKPDVKGAQGGKEVL